jgi:hypothetical protein
MRTMLTSFVILCLAMVLGTAAAAESGFAQPARLVSVNQNICPTATYTSIQSAVDASAPGDTINVCPGLYDEQLVISKPLTIRGVAVNHLDRALIQPSAPVPDSSDNLAVVTVQNTDDVHLENMAVDASKNTVSSCAPILSAVHFFNAGGEVEHDAISGAKITNPAGCATLFGNGFGVLLESTGAGPLRVSVEDSSIHDYSKEGVRGIGNGLTARVKGNVISGVGPAGGFFFQFGIFVLNGAVAQITGNQITEGDCGALSLTDCINARSEGVVLRAVGDGSVVEQNVITRAQAGIFVNFANKAQIRHNLIANITGLDGIDAQGMSNSVLDGNTIFNATPVANQSCGIFESPGPGTAGGIEADNKIVNTLVNDAFCGVAYVPTSSVKSGQYYNVMYTAFRSDQGPPQ